MPDSKNNKRGMTVKWNVLLGEKVLYSVATKSLAEDHAFVWEHYHEGDKPRVVPAH